MNKMSKFRLVIYIVFVILSIKDVVGSHLITSGVDHFKDIFLPGSDGKKTLGTTKATCWARGGICVHIRECNSDKMDVGVPGCAWGFMVCCKVFNFGPPTVGLQRKSNNLRNLRDLEDLEGVSIEILAEKNSKLLKRLVTG